jgi:hypothetical protein
MSENSKSEISRSYMEESKIIHSANKSHKTHIRKSSNNTNRTNKTENSSNTNKSNNKIGFIDHGNYKNSLLKIVTCNLFY